MTHYFRLDVFSLVEIESLKHNINKILKVKNIVWVYYSQLLTKISSHFIL